MASLGTWQQGPFAGVHLFTANVFTDDRGTFAKTFHEGWFAERDIAFAMREEFFTSSRQDVIRGMHFQVPPFQHAKLVMCVRGLALDVLLDLRRGEPTYGQTWSAPLTGDRPGVIVVPAGVAHGFLARVDDTIMHYKTTSVHSAQHDAGIRWDSFGFKWPVANPVVSERDRGFPAWSEFNSPF